MHIMIKKNTNLKLSLGNIGGLGGLGKGGRGGGAAVTVEPIVSGGQTITFILAL